LYQHLTILKFVLPLGLMEFLLSLSNYQKLYWSWPLF